MNPICLLHEFYLQVLPFDERDIPHILNVIFTIKHSEAVLYAFPYVNEEVPITIVDKGLLL